MMMMGDDENDDDDSPHISSPLKSAVQADSDSTSGAVRTGTLGYRRWKSCSWRWWWSMEEGGKDSRNGGGGGN